MSRINNNGKVDGYTDDYMRIPVIESKYTKFKKFFYNPEKKKVLGKNRKQWGKYFNSFIFIYIYIYMLYLYFIYFLCAIYL